MEFVFLIISIIVGLLSVYGVGRLMNSHKELMRIYKTDELMVSMNLFVCILLICIVFVTLCACNNTFWLLPYLTR